MCNSLSINFKGVEGQISGIVTSGMIAGIERHTGSTAELRRPFLRLVFLGASEDTARGDTHVKEGTVVGATVEGGGGGVQVSISVEVFEEGFDLSGAGRTADIEG